VSDQIGHVIRDSHIDRTVLRVRPNTTMAKAVGKVSGLRKRIDLMALDDYSCGACDRSDRTCAIRIGSLIRCRRIDKYALQAIIIIIRANAIPINVPNLRRTIQKITTANVYAAAINKQVIYNSYPSKPSLLPLGLGKISCINSPFEFIIATIQTTSTVHGSNAVRKPKSSKPGFVERPLTAMHPPISRTACVAFLPRHE